MWTNCKTITTRDSVNKLKNKVRNDRVCPQVLQQVVIEFIAIGSLCAQNYNVFYAMATFN